MRHISTEFARRLAARPALTMTLALLAVMFATWPIGCAAPGSMRSEPGRALTAQMMMLSDRLAASYAEDLALQLELIDRLLVVQRAADRHRILADLDALLTPGGEPDAARFDEWLASGESNALVNLVRHGHAARGEALALLRDHAESWRLSNATRRAVEDRILAHFPAFRALSEERASIQQSIDSRREAVLRLADELRASLLVLRRSGEEALSVIDPVSKASGPGVRSLLIASAAFIDDDAKRAAIRGVIDEWSTADFDDFAADVGDGIGTIDAPDGASR